MANPHDPVSSPVETEVTQVIIEPSHMVAGGPPGQSGSTGKTIDITDLVVAIDVNESIDLRIMTADMLITDGVGVLANLPLVGQEKVTFTIHKGAIDSAHKEWTKDLIFFVRSIENVSKENDFTLSYQLRLVEEAYFLNSLNIVSQSYTGTISDIMTEIHDEFLIGETNGEAKITTEEPTAGTFKVIIPNWTPYAALKWLTRRARSEDNSPCYLFNTLFDGMQLKSSRAMFDSTPINDRTLYTQKEHVPEGRSDVQKGAVMDLKHTVDMAFFFEMLETTPVSAHILNGVYGSKYKTLNTSNKVVDEKIWNYKDEFEALPKLSKFKVASDKKLYNGKTLSEYNGKEFLFAYSGDAHNASSHMTYNEDSLNAVPYKNSTDQHLGNYSYKLGVPGDKEIQVGKTINLHLIKNEMIGVDEADKAKDHRKSGKHIITMIKHRFHLPKMQYTQMIEINRDTMERDHADEN